MLAHVMSDLHLGSKTNESQERFWNKIKERVQTDRPELLILAGDITDAYNEIYKERITVIIQKFSQLYPKVIFIAGNHDYWDSNIDDRLMFFRTFNTLHNNVRFLEPTAQASLPNERQVSGGTMWFPDCGDETLKGNWCDHNYIEGGMDGDIEAEHEYFLKKVQPQALMVTHHYPTEESIHPRFKNHTYNCFFAAQMDGTLTKWSEKGVMPKVWIHGHTHEPMDYVSKWGFRVYCNPLGHEYEGRNPDFWNRICLDI